MTHTLTALLWVTFILAPKRHHGAGKGLAPWAPSKRWC